MKQIFAPWRMSYIDREKELGQGCVLCDLSRGGPSEESLVLYAGRHAYVVLNRYPYVSGHLMVVPHSHVDSPLKLEAADWLGAIGMVPGVVRALEGAYHPHGFNIGMNIGRAAGAGIEEHIHVHVVPRWGGDNNFVPVLTETRVIPEALEVTWRRLRPAFVSLEEESSR